MNNGGNKLIDIHMTLLKNNESCTITSVFMSKIIGEIENESKGKESIWMLGKS